MKEKHRCWRSFIDNSIEIWECTKCNYKIFFDKDSIKTENDSSLYTHCGWTAGNTKDGSNAKFDSESPKIYQKNNINLN